MEADRRLMEVHGRFTEAYGRLMEAYGRFTEACQTRVFLPKERSDGEAGGPGHHPNSGVRQFCEDCFFEDGS